MAAASGRQAVTSDNAVGPPCGTNARRPGERATGALAGTRVLRVRRPAPRPRATGRSRLGRPWEAGAARQLGIVGERIDVLGVVPELAERRGQPRQVADDALDVPDGPERAELLRR